MHCGLRMDWRPVLSRNPISQTAPLTSKRIPNYDCLYKLIYCSLSDFRLICTSPGTPAGLCSPLRIWPSRPLLAKDRQENRRRERSSIGIKGPSCFPLPSCVYSDSDKRCLLINAPDNYKISLKSIDFKRSPFWKAPPKALWSVKKLSCALPVHWKGGKFYLVSRGRGALYLFPSCWPVPCRQIVVTSPNIVNQPPCVFVCG